MVWKPSPSLQILSKALQAPPPKGTSAPKPGVGIAMASRCAGFSAQKLSLQRGNPTSFWGPPKRELIEGKWDPHCFTGKSRFKIGWMFFPFWSKNHHELSWRKKQTPLIFVTWLGGKYTMNEDVYFLLNMGIFQCQRSFLLCILFRLSWSFLFLGLQKEWFQNLFSTRILLSILSPNLRGFLVV